MIAGPLILLRYSAEAVSLVGQMGLSLQLTQIATAGLVAFLTAAYPVLARTNQRQDPKVKLYGGLVAVGIIVGFGVLTALAIWIGPFVVTGVFGEDFGSAGQILWVCLLASGSGLICLGYEQVLTTKNLLWGTVWIHVFSALLFSVLFFPFYESHGLVGTAIALGIAQCLKSITLIAWYLVSETSKAGDGKDQD